jgi:hypothetical protein
MQTVVKSKLETAWEFVTRTARRALPKLSLDEQTRRSWARAIEGRDQVPEAYRSFFETGSGSAGPFPYTVLTPSYEGFLRPTVEKLVCCSDRQIHILEMKRHTLNCTSFAYDAIAQIEYGVLLLHSWITISGTADNQALATATFKFNSVTAHLFGPILEKMRPAADPTGGADLRVEQAKFDPLMRSNYKFMNYARRSLRPGARVVQSLMQPELRAKLVTLFGRTLSRSVAAAHMLILTDSELILVREEESSRWGHDRPYGGIWSYIPLDKITSVTVTERDASLLVLSIALAGQAPLTSLFSASNKPAVELLASQTQTLAAALRQASQTGDPCAS